MNRRNPFIVSLAATTALAAALLGSCSHAAKLNVGDPAPDWAALPGIDDKTHSLADYKDAKLIVLTFTCNHCPVATAYEDRIVALREKYKDRAVQVIAVNVNNGEADRLPAMKKRAAAKGFAFPYLYDQSQKIGRDYGATVTPHVFVLDADRKIAYIGAIDDNQNPARVTQHYLADALDALLAGEKPPKAVTKEFGCGIQWD